MDASSLHNDWWQKVRKLWNPPKVVKEGEEEEEDLEGEEDCTPGRTSLDHCCGSGRVQHPHGLKAGTFLECHDVQHNIASNHEAFSERCSCGVYNT